MDENIQNIIQTKIHEIVKIKNITDLEELFAVELVVRGFVLLISSTESYLQSQIYIHAFQEWFERL